MPLISPAELEEIKRSVDLASLVQSKGIKLEKHGKDLKGLCPFHPDKSPSLIVTPGKNLFHCMSCDAGGDAIGFLMKYEGVSFRHAVELLREGKLSALSGGPPRQRATVPRLEAPVEVDAEDETQLAKVIDYYHERLLSTTPAQEYLKKRGLFSLEAIQTFRLGYADRTLGLRLPERNRKDGEKLRSQLQKLGLYRETGREHFNGCLVIPILNRAGGVTGVYGRRLDDSNAHKGSPKHLYLPGPHRGVWNPASLESEEVILCEAILDALSFWVLGFRNVTSSYGACSLTDEIVESFLRHRVKKVRLAYDADEAGDRGAASAAERLGALGLECFRVRFPRGLDANLFMLQRGAEAEAAFRELLGGAEWLGESSRPRALHKNKLLAANESVVKPESPASLAVEAAEPRPEEALALAAKEKKPEGPAAPVESPSLEKAGDYHLLRLGLREYRLGGLEKNNSLEVMKVALRLRVGERFHLDSLDLMQDSQRRRFIERASEETLLEKELIKRDLGRVLLALEVQQTQRLASLMAPEAAAKTDELMSEEEKAEALAFLKSPDLVEKISQAFDSCGLVGERTNRLAAYLACTSRKLERPLALIIQSTSAAGKSTLMEAVLAMFPEEERVKYSAMTGQSLYYLGETNLKHKILAVVEEEGAEKASYALKLLQSEGELTIASTGKDPKTGRMETQVYRIEGPVMIFLTTTAVEIDEELLNRCLILSVDETREQTERIHALQREARTLEGLRRRQGKPKLLKLLRNAQRLLAPIKVMNPYACFLTFPTNLTRTRRDHEKYLSLMDAVALLHQHQREKEIDNAGETLEFVRVSLDDIKLANQLAPELLGRSLDELPPQTRRLLGQIKNHVRERMSREVAPQASILFSRRELRSLSGWSEFQVRVHLNKLESLEYVARRWGRQGQGCFYELVVDAAEADNLWHIGLLDVEKLRTQA